MKNETQQIKLDSKIKRFLMKVRSGQSNNWYFWANGILKRNYITMPELEKLMGLGF